jgi:hypothetical protein
MKNSKPKTYAAKMNGKDVRVTVPENPTPTEAFDDAIRDSLSPKAVAAIAANLSGATCKDSAVNKEIIWFANRLIGLIGSADEYNSLCNEIGY